MVRNKLQKGLNLGFSVLGFFYGVGILGGYDLDMVTGLEVSKMLGMGIGLLGLGWLACSLMNKGITHLMFGK